MVTGVVVACGVVLVMFAVARLVMGRVQARPQLHGLRCPGCGREQKPADLARVSWMYCSDPTCAYVILNKSGKTGPAPGCPGCGREQKPADLARVSWMYCSDPTCAYVILNKSGKTGPAPGWPPIAVVRRPPPSPQASDRRKGGST